MSNTKKYTIEIAIDADSPESASVACGALYYATEELAGLPADILITGASLYDTKQREAKKLAELYDVVTGGRFEEFTAEFGSLLQHITMDEGAPSKQEILDELSFLFKGVLSC